MGKYGAKTVIISINEAKRFVHECLIATRTPDNHARVVTESLIYCDERGHFAQGMHRLEMMLTSIETGACDPKAVPAIMKESPTTAWVDGRNGIGLVVCQYCMNLAIQKATENIISLVSANNSNYTGMLEYHVNRALKKGLMAFGFANTYPFLCPPEARDPIIGINPICFGAPGENKDSFLLDMATAAGSLGQIEISKQRNLPLPLGWAKDNLGRITTDARVALESRLLIPLAAYKGFGLAMFSEIISAVLSGAKFGKELSVDDHTTSGGTGLTLIAINAEAIVPNFKTRLSSLLNNIRHAESIHPNRPLVVAGDPEREHMRRVENDGGIRYFPYQVHNWAKIGRKLNVTPMRPIGMK